MGHDLRAFVLAILGLSAPVLAQAQSAIAELEREEAALPVVVKGRVLHQDGRPAAKALVATSAGGLAVADEDGEYVIEVRVSPDVRVLEVTATANGPPV